MNFLRSSAVSLCPSSFASFAQFSSVNTSLAPKRIFTASSALEDEDKSLKSILCNIDKAKLILILHSSG